jgi:hypothetical protein
VPALFLHGTDDRLVSFSQSEKTRQALHAKKIPPDLVPIRFPGYGFRKNDWTEALIASIKFLDSEFKQVSVKIPAASKEVFCWFFCNYWLLLPAVGLLCPTY